MQNVATAALGFLLAVLWFDLMFDRLPASQVDTIAAYYRRVTTTARPMNFLVSAAMVAAFGAQAVEVVRGDDPRWLSIASLALTALGIVLAAARTVRNAVRLGAQTDDTAAQIALARGIRHDHVICLVAIGAALGLQLVPR